MRKGIGLLLALLLLVGCGGEPGGQTGAQDEAGVPSQAIDSTVVAEAVIEPAHWTTLGFKAAGVVVEVLVEEGQAVEAGDLVVMLDSTDAELAVQQAEVALQAAQAQLALSKAGARPQEIAAAQAQVKAAEARQAQAAAQRDQVMAGPGASETAAAEAHVASALADKMKADDAHDATMECFTFENPYSGEEREVCPGLGPSEEQARAFLAAAEEALTAAEARLADLQARPHSSDLRTAEASVGAAKAQRNVAQAQLDVTQAGPTEEEVAVAEAQVTRAQAALEAAEAALAHTEVRAAFAGTVLTVNAEVGNAVGPGQVACVLATVDQLRARTKDLSELDVAGIEVGQSVIVTVDALPEREFEGVVRKVALQAQDVRGEAVFPVTVELMDTGDAPLRWGMTAWVELETP